MRECTHLIARCAAIEFSGALKGIETLVGVACERVIHLGRPFFSIRRRLCFVTDADGLRIVLLWDLVDREVLRIDC